MRGGDGHYAPLIVLHYAPQVLVRLERALLEKDLGRDSSVVANPRNMCGCRR